MVLMYKNVIIFIVTLYYDYICNHSRSAQQMEKVFDYNKMANSPNDNGVEYDKMALVYH